MSTIVTPLDAHTALVVVDMQNDFAHPSGSLCVAGGADLLQPINRLVGEVDAAGGKVYYTQDFHPAETPHFAAQGGLWPQHGVQGTFGAEFVDGLDVRGIVIQKGVDGRDGYSGFSLRDPQSGATASTVLSDRMRADGITRVIVVGLALDYCVGETGIDGAGLGFVTELPLAYTRPVNLSPDDADKMIARCKAAGVTVTPAA